MFNIKILEVKHSLIIMYEKLKHFYIVNTVYGTIQIA